MILSLGYPAKTHELLNCCSWHPKTKICIKWHTNQAFCAAEVLSDLRAAMCRLMQPGSPSHHVLTTSCPPLSGSSSKRSPLDAAAKRALSSGRYQSPTIFVPRQTSASGSSVRFQEATACMAGGGHANWTVVVEYVGSLTDLCTAFVIPAIADRLSLSMLHLPQTKCCFGYRGPHCRYQGPGGAIAANDHWCSPDYAWRVFEQSWLTDLPVFFLGSRSCGELKLFPLLPDAKGAG